MRRRRGLFPYVLGVIWAALVVLSIVEMANFSATFTRAQPGVKPVAAPVAQTRATRRSM